MTRKLFLAALCCAAFGAVQASVAQAMKSSAAAGRAGYEYLLLATNKTSTMQKEMNQAGVEGYRFEGVMGGETAAGGNEAVIIMSREVSSKSRISYEYRLLATKKTSTMQKELNAAAEQGFDYRGQTIYDSAFGGREVVVIMEKNTEKHGPGDEYLLLATNRTSTMQKELNEAGRSGFIFCGITLAETSFGGKEVVSILRRPRSRAE